MRFLVAFIKLGTPQKTPTSGGGVARDDEDALRKITDIKLLNGDRGAQPIRTEYAGTGLATTHSYKP